MIPRRNLLLQLGM